MIKRTGFTLIELLFFITIISLLMAILMPALSRVKKQANTTACQGQFKQWALIFAMYTNDNEGYFHNRPFGTNYLKMWPQFCQPYYSDPMMRCCPAARNPDCNLGPLKKPKAGKANGSTRTGAGEAPGCQKKVSSAAML